VPKEVFSSRAVLWTGAASGLIVRAYMCVWWNASDSHSLHHGDMPFGDEEAGQARGLDSDPGDSRRLQTSEWRIKSVGREPRKPMKLRAKGRLPCR